MEKHTRESVLALLHGKYVALCAAGENRYPRRSDFSDPEVCAIKAFLGPWPRALEAAGIKPPRNDDRLAPTEKSGSAPNEIGVCGKRRTIPRSPQPSSQTTKRSNTL